MYSNPRGLYRIVRILHRKSKDDRLTEYHPDTWEDIKINGLPPGGVPGYVGPFTANIVFRGKRYKIPVGIDGCVLAEDLVRRFYKMDGKNRDTSRDKARDAERILKGYNGLRPEDIIEWWADPSSCDILGIDDSKHWIIANEYYDDPERAEVNEWFYISPNFTESEKTTIREALNSSFSLDELKMVVSDGTVNIVPAFTIEHGAAGAFSPINNEITLRVAKRNAKNPEDTRNIIDKKTVIHEVVHALKYHEIRRKHPVTRSHFDDYYSHLDDNLAEAHRFQDLEESETELESISRLTPYSTPSNPGYYAHLPESRVYTDDPQQRFRVAKDLMMDDRDKIDKKKTLIGQTGKTLLNRIERKYENTHISRLQYFGDTPAIETARRVKKNEKEESRRKK